MVYTPKPGFIGTDTIRYTVGDDLTQQSEQATITLDIAPAPAPPNTQTGSFTGESTTIDLSQLPDPNGTLDLDSILIVVNPQHGSVTILPGGKLDYQANEGYFGTDSFQYTISDVDGRRSAPVTVTVNTVNSRMQNPAQFADVNANGVTAALDALLIINYIARSIREGGSSSVPVLDTDRGPNFYDVDGNRFVTPLDALRVINFIAAENRTRLASGEGEALLSAPEIELASMDVSVQTVAEIVATNIKPRVNLGDIADEVTLRYEASVDLLSWHADDKESESDRLQAVDQAWSDFSEL